MSEPAPSPGIRPILLAAGRSSRFEGAHKLLATIDGRSVVALAARALVDAGLGRPLVVLGARAEEVGAALGRELAGSVDLVTNPEFESGMGGSIALAARLVSEGEAVLIALADMPLLPAADHRAVAEALGTEPLAVARGRAEGRPGHPVAFGPAWRRRLAELSGDRGAASLLGDARVSWVDLDPVTQLDVDTHEALEEARAIAASVSRRRPRPL